MIFPTHPSNAIPQVLNEEIGRECTLCGAECKNVHVVHVLWECSTYSTCRDNFQEVLKQLDMRNLKGLALSKKHHTYVLISEN